MEGGGVHIFLHNSHKLPVYFANFRWLKLCIVSFKMYFCLSLKMRLRVLFGFMWSSKSLDANSLENSWRFLARMVYNCGKKFETEDLKAAVRET